MMAHKAMGTRKPRGAKPIADPVLTYAYVAPAKAEPTTTNGVIEKHIVTQVIEAAQQNGSFDPMTRPILVGRVRYYLREIQDPALVQFVLTEIIKREGDNFIPLKHFSPGCFEYIRWHLGYPDGSWKYALWAESVEDRALRSSVDYWITRWIDRLPEIDPRQADADSVITRCKAMLEKLYRQSMLESLSW